MPTLSITPFFGERPFLYPYPDPQRHPVSLFAEITHIAGQLERLRRQLGMFIGVIPRSDHFEVELDVPGYKLEDLNVCVQDDTLTISGTHDEKNKSGTHYQHRRFSRRFILPENVEADKMKSTFSNDGRISCLRVEAPFKQAAIEGKEKVREIPELMGTSSS